jgi:uridine kinase
MPQRVSRETALAAIAALPRDRTLFVGVDGYGGAGKTTFEAAAAVPGLIVVHVDDFAAPDVPEWDWDRLRAQVLLPLLAGRPARYQRWDWHTNTGAEWHDVPVDRIVLIEGVSSTRREVGAPWTLTVWIDTPLEARLQRALERDGAHMLPRWLDDWLPSEEAYVAREDPLSRVDYIVSGEEKGRPSSR